jgi:hypothetical protein
MAKPKLVIQHDLSKLTPEEVKTYLADVSEFIGLDPALNGLDTIWMQNENGPGQSLVVYARRGTAEILREIHGIDVVSLTNQMVKDSIVFTAVGKSNGEIPRQEVATGSKYIGGLQGKALDDAIMTASTRALRRLTMQFTKLGILDESEVRATVGDTSNPAAGAALSGSPLVIPPMPTVTNNAPGRDITPILETTIDHIENTITHTTSLPEPDIDKVYAEGKAALAAMPTPGGEAAADAAATRRAMVAAVYPQRQSFSRHQPLPLANAHAVSANAPPLRREFPGGEAAAGPDPVKPKRARKAKNTVSMDVEPEVVSNAPVSPKEPVSAPVEAPRIVEIPSAAPVVPPAAQVVPQPAPLPPAAVVAPSTDFAGKPTEAQMADYRKRVSVYTSELPASESMGSVQKMRAFITRQSGAAPQFMTTEQWEEILAWFDSFVEKNQMKGLVKYINDSLGVK